MIVRLTLDSPSPSPTKTPVRSRRLRNSMSLNDMNNALSDINNREFIYLSRMHFFPAENRAGIFLSHDVQI